MEDDLIASFLEESWEGVNQLDQDIVALEKAPQDKNLLDSIFRTIHTIKGTCGFLGLLQLGTVSHAAESALDLLRKGTRTIDKETISLILDAVDCIKEMLTHLETHNKEVEQIDEVIVSRLNDYINGGSPKSSGSQDPSTQQETAQMTTPASENQGGLDPSDFIGADGEIDFEAMDNAINQMAAQHRESLKSNETAEAASTPEQPAAEATSAKAVVEEETPAEAPVADQFAESAESSSGKSKETKNVAELSIRVHVDVIDELMNLVGELVLTRNQLLQMARGDDESKYAGPITHLNRVTTDLQEGVMKTRMQPIGNVWGKLPRLVRDLSRITNKEIDLEMTGAETELDRTVLDAIKDPLTHMVRNSADHGLEARDERKKVGKPERGRIHLQAFHEGGHVVICIEDDGRGINTSRVRDKAIANGLITSGDASRMTEHEIHQLIFRPGFSTAEAVSSVSGRGVGMDVVKTEIERIGGTVDLISKLGKGTTVKIKIPLTLAIISALVVESGGESFAIPQLGVVELVRLPFEEAQRIETIHDNQVFRLRDRLLPLIYLHDAMQLPSRENGEQGDINIVVVQVGEEQMGLVVDEVFDTEEIVVKPVGSLLKDLGIYQGTTILGDGRVIMILDVAGIAGEHGGMQSGSHDQVGGEADTYGNRTRLLLFDSGNNNCMAVPLSLVSRLEEFSANAIERNGESCVVQYRGTLLPLLPVHGLPPQQELDPQPVIVFTDGAQSMGLMVNEIRDVVDEELVISMQSQTPGVLGTSIINEKATNIIDTQHYLLQANPDWFAESQRDTNRQIMVIDGSPFFRQMIETALEAEHCNVTTAGSLEEYLEITKKKQAYDAFVVDLDLPHPASAEVLGEIRSKQEQEQTPVIGLTTRQSSAFIQRMQEAGCNKVLAKLDPYSLVSSIEELCENQEFLQGRTA